MIAFCMRLLDSIYACKASRVFEDNLQFCLKEKFDINVKHCPGSLHVVTKRFVLMIKIT